MKQLLRFVAIAIVVLCLSGCNASTAATTNQTAAYNDGRSEEMAASSDTAASMNEKEDDETITGDKLVYSGSLSLETLEYEKTVKALREKIRSYNGVVENESEYGNGYNRSDLNDESYNVRSLSLTVRIPTEHFDDFMNSMDGEGKVTGRSSYVENITKQYNNTQIEIESLEAQQKRLLEMMDQAETIEDMVTIESRLSDVQTQLRQKKNEQSTMDTDVKYSTVSIDISEVKEYSSAGSHDLSGFGQRILNGLRNGGSEFLWFLQSVVVFAVTYLWFIVLAVGLIVLIHFLRKRRKKKKNSEEKKPS